LSGLGGIPERINHEKFKEAQTPNQVAISLSGEPTLYPDISGLIKAYQKHDFSTFLVTNGTLPEVLEKMHLPSQLYVSLEAIDLEMHKKINYPTKTDSWEKINQTLELLPKLKTRKCIRVTAIKGMNMSDQAAQGFADLIKKSQADFVEVKGYSWIGFSRHRLQEENSPSHAEVKEFAAKINKGLGYNLVDEFKDSRVVLLWNNSTPLKIER
jgi:tRNA wybutosine-synthesizing protein 1